MIMRSIMSSNRMFVISAEVIDIREKIEERCLQAAAENTEEIWHKRYGHINHGSLQMLAEKEIVKGLPKINKDGE